MIKQGFSSTSISNKDIILIQTLGDTIHEYEIWESIESGTSGVVTVPDHGTIILDQYEDAKDCLIVKTDATTGRPVDDVAREADGTIITGTLDITGAYTLSGIPATYPVAIIFQIQLPERWKTEELSLSQIINEKSVPSAIRTTYDNSGSNLNAVDVKGAIDQVQGNNPGITFNTSNTTPPAEGEVVWDSVCGCPAVGMQGGVVALQVGQEQLLRARATEPVGNGQAVYISGSTGDNPQATLADNTSLTSAAVIGLATETIETGKFGYIATFGQVRNLNTTGLTEGAIVWLDSTSGELTSNRPDAPAFNAMIGICLRNNATEGKIFVNVDILPRLEGLSDVYVRGTLAENDQLSWNATTERFEIFSQGTTKEPTGFTTPQDVVITDNGDRTVTLTGTVNAYYQGRKNDALVSGYTSPAHGTDTTTKYFLTYNGVDIAWKDLSVEALHFSDLLIAYSFYDPNNLNWVYMRECHSLMPWQTHREFHENVGTYRRAGGTLGNYVIGSTTLADRRPSVTTTTIYDEDLPTINPFLPLGGPYTNAYLTSTGLISFALDQTDVVPLSGSQPYYNSFDGANWNQTLMSNNSYMSIWLIAVPATLGTNTQKYRYLWMQGQSEGTLVNESALQPQDLSLGNFAEASPEYVFVSHVVIRYTAGDWRFAEVQNLTGNRFIQSSSPSGLYLSSVASDTTLTGDGTTENPLSVTDYANLANTTEATTFDSSLGVGGVLSTTARNKDITFTTASIALNETIHEVVVCDNTADIIVSFPMSPPRGTVFTIKRLNTGEVNISVPVDGISDLVVPQTGTYIIFYNGTQWNFG